MYYIYILRCSDNSLYCGITNNLEKRMYEHFNQTKNCAKYTKNHEARKLESVYKCDNRSNASKLEYYFKHLKKDQKEAIINNQKVINDYLNDVIDCDIYIKIY